MRVLDRVCDSSMRARRVSLLSKKRMTRLFSLRWTASAMHVDPVNVRVQRARSRTNMHAQHVMLHTPPLYPHPSPLAMQAVCFTVSFFATSLLLLLVPVEPLE